MFCRQILSARLAFQVITGGVWRTKDGRTVIRFCVAKFFRDWPRPRYIYEQGKPLSGTVFWA